MNNKRNVLFLKVQVLYPGIGTDTRYLYWHRLHPHLKPKEQPDISDRRLKLKFGLAEGQRSSHEITITNHLGVAPKRILHDLPKHEKTRLQVHINATWFLRNHTS